MKKLKAFDSESIRYAKKIEAELKAMPPAERRQRRLSMMMESDSEAQMIADSFGGELID